MKYRLEYFPETMRTVLTFEYDHSDEAIAEYKDHNRAMLRLLERQQASDPTAEGVLMIMQQHAQAIQRGQGTLRDMP